MARHEPLASPPSIVAWVLLVMFTGAWLLMAWPYAFLAAYLLLAVLLRPLIGSVHFGASSPLAWAFGVFGIVFYLLVPAAIAFVGGFILSGRPPRRWAVVRTGAALAVAPPLVGTAIFVLLGG